MISLRRLRRVADLLWLIVTPIIVVSGCSSHSVVDYAERNEMTVREVYGAEFHHLVIERAGESSGNTLHVYIEGDGLPWTGNYPSADPTPRNTMALRLAGKDSNDVAYIGRPCYFGLTGSARCGPKYWTSHRYGEEVLRSMAGVIQRIRQPRHTEIVLIGHSGGGVLAALLENRIDGVVGVITIGANLDIDQWVRHHDYDPLTGSLNPAAQTRNSFIPHLQLIGEDDKTVPASTSENYSRNQPNVELRVFDDFDHVCCWEKSWPGILNEFTATLAN